MEQPFRVCIFCIRTFIHRVLEPPDDVKKLFQDYSQNGIMSMDDLLNFLSKVQGQNNAKEDDAEAIFNTLKHLNIFPRKGLNLEAFYRYLLGDLNTPLSPCVHQDMTAPLAHYFMYTGHNSYLSGNQLSSESSVRPIKKALQNGVRVIELDLWPARNNDVVVRHGRTLTTSVKLLRCLRAIKEFAFEVSEYPVVITFEDHLTADLQDKVAEMVTKTFGDMLYRPETDELEKLSPESLKKKILISTKPPREYLETQDSNSPHKSEKSSEEQGGDEKLRSSTINLFSCSSMCFTKQDQIDEGEQVQGEDEEMTIPKYRDLIAIPSGKPKGGLEEWLRIDEKDVRRLSLSEQELEKATRTHGKDIVRITKNNLLRVYPKGTRLDSSNYDPFVGWKHGHGAQMVAFNMQGYGRPLWIMQGMFRANGGCGYVKKPDFLLREKDDFDPSVSSPVYKILKVKIYSGEGWHLDFRHTHFDPYSPPDFLVGIVGVDACETSRTQVVKNSWLPEWNKEFKFEVAAPELSVLGIEVSDDDKYGSPDFAGQTYLPISELRTGIRAVPLHDRRGVRYKSARLLMRFDLKDSPECSE
ncbi:PREDICTED: phosphoinositide phospholipase C 1-like isoform X3 [Populus euphratica]|uniref:Phosphoinositide phospholipase C n=1 Tax=Populus euphratica TaxID=75702 RepID=A0AAJ6ULV0_POPEU|nr:PREDICTED: phosphoinositide phospholipase C 1-like isoform X3 [Populus euphratica]